jgi:predicted secreted protein
MACYAGRNGVITLDGTAVAQITSYTVNEVADTAECTHFDTTGGYREYATTFKSFDGSMDVVWDRQDNTITVGTQYAMILYPEGNDGSTDWGLQGNIIITGLEISAELEGNVEASISFQGTGALEREAEVGGTFPT